MPEVTMDYHDTWSECSRQGTINTMGTIDLLGDNYINSNKTYVTFTCRQVNTT